jgi:SAM-dependent methyltransferase
MEEIDYSALSAPIEESIRLRGVIPQAVWLDRDADLLKGLRRCEAIFRMVDERTPFSLVDVGCGPGMAIPFLEERFGSSMQQYCGIDISDQLIGAALQRWPKYTFQVQDLIKDPLPSGSFDYAVLNGVLTAKFSLAHDTMESFAMALLESVWRSTRFALAFNVMSTHVDWERDDLFHWPIEKATSFCAKRLSRNFNVIADYGLYEYTVIVFRNPRNTGMIPQGWLDEGVRLE